MYAMCVCGGQRAVCRSRFSPSSTWGLGFKLVLSVRLGGLHTLKHLAAPFIQIRKHGLTVGVTGQA